MRTIDLTPLHRFAVGFDHMQRQLDQLARLDGSETTYPPYNIEVLGENEYRITMAIAGFGEKDLGITLENSHLTVSGRIEQGESERHYLHHGIAARAFERRFQLADHIKIRGAKLDNGLLHIELEREVPEELKPRKIAIQSTTSKAIEHTSKSRAA
ncbi:MAG: Hsp20 family protein [Rhodospirillales bacterium]|nr:Hsp20 family protein [Rhodospirillales bacterium]